MASPSDPSNNQTCKANDYAMEALRQLFTLAAAILALTITFLKDALGEARSLAQFTYIVPISWTLLLITVWSAWVATAEATKKIGKGETIGYAFSKESKARNLAMIAQWSFLIGLACLGFFAIANYTLLFHH